MIGIHDTSVPIVVLQFMPWLHHGGLGIARTAGRLGIRVYWVHGQPWAPPGALSRYVYGRTFWDPDAPAEASVEYLLEWGRRIGGRPILIPIDDKSAIFVADQAEALRERFLFPNQPAGLARALSSKKEMHFLCKKMGVPTPEAAFPRSGDDVATFVETAVFPIVLKRIAGWLPENRTRMKSVTIVNSPEELLEEYEKLETPGEPNVMLQEYIPGGPEAVWMFNGFFTNHSECLASFTGKKIRQSPPFTGATTLGVCLENETVEKTTIDFMRKIGYSGIVDMGYRYDRRDGQYKLLDVNPRVGATFRLFAGSNGTDVVRALYLDLTGQPVGRGVLREGRKWIVEQSDLWSSLQYARLGRLKLTEWVRSLSGIEEGAWFARDDLVPFAAMCGVSLVKAGRKLEDRARAVCGIQKLRGAAPGAGRRARALPALKAEALPHRDHQEQVDSYFDSVSSYWAEIYDTRSVEGVIYQERKAVVLRWIDELALPRRSRILEVGCGAGLTTIELARRGYMIDGVDSSEAMVERALRSAIESDAGDRVRVFRGNTYSLPFEDDLFDLVLAIGVIPWIESPGMAVREMARVVKPGGYMILSSDNRARLNHLMDPRRNPALGPLRRLFKSVLERTGLRKSRYFVPSHFYSTSYIDRLVSQNRLEKTEAVTLGFGPFSFLGRTLLPDSVGIGLHRRLQALADRGVAGIRSAGSQYLVLARKPQNPGGRNGPTSQGR